MSGGFGGYEQGMGEARKLGLVHLVFLIALQTLLACVLIAGCTSPSGPIRLDSNTEHLVVPPNFLDLRQERSKRTVTDRNKTYYGDDTIVPSIASRLWFKLDQALRKENCRSSPKVLLEEGEVVVTLPRAEDAAMGGPLVWLADRKYLLVNISGKVESKIYTAGVYKKQFSYPDADDVAVAVNEAVDGAVIDIIKQLKLLGVCTAS